MKKYSFRLQTVLDIREKTLEDKRLEMAKVIAKLNEQIEYLEGLSKKRDLARESLERIYSGTEELDVREITNYKDFIGRMTTEEKNQGQLIERTKALLKLKQIEVTNALKDVKVLEKLKETQEKKFYQNYEHVQAKEIDDIATTRYKKVLA